MLAVLQFNSNSVSAKDFDLKVNSSELNNINDADLFRAINFCSLIMTKKDGWTWDDASGPLKGNATINHSRVLPNRDCFNIYFVVPNTVLRSPIIDNTQLIRSVSTFNRE